MSNKNLVEELYLCSAECDACAKACNEEEDRENLKRCIMLDKECLEICRLTGSLIEEDSENADKFVQLCVEICNACAIECQGHHHDHCQKCAAECRCCAEMCSEYLQHASAMN